MPNDLHEARVREFFATAQLADPERYAVVCERYPVKSKRQLRRIAETEVTAGLQPLKLRRLRRPTHSRNESGERRFEPVLEAS